MTDDRTPDDPYDVPPAPMDIPAPPQQLRHALEEDVLAALRLGRYEMAEGMLAAMDDQRIARFLGSARLLATRVESEYRARGGDEPKRPALYLIPTTSEEPPWHAQ